MKKTGLIICLLTFSVKVFGQAPPPPPPPPPSDVDYKQYKRPIDLQAHRPLTSRIAASITSKLTGRHQRIRGTRIFTPSLDEFTYDGFKFIYKKDPTFWFILTDKGRNYNYTSDSIGVLMREDLQSKKIVKDIYINQRKGICFENIDTIAGLGGAFVLLDLGESSLMGTFLLDVKNEMLMESYTNILNNLFYKPDYPLDPKETVHFSLDTAFTGFKLARVSYNTLIYTQDGTYDDINNVYETNFMISELGPVTYQQARATLESLPATIEKMGCSGKLLDSDSRMTDDNVILIREYQLTCKQNSQDHYMFNALIINKSFTWVFQGTSYNRIDYNQKWMETVKTIKARK